MDGRSHCEESDGMDGEHDGDPGGGDTVSIGYTIFMRHQMTSTHADADGSQIRFPTSRH